MRLKSLSALMGLAVAACSDLPPSRDAPSTGEASAAAVVTREEAEAETPAAAPAETTRTTAGRSEAPVVRASDQTLCGEFDEVVYSCRINDRILSVCTSPAGDISYTYGRSLREAELGMGADADDGTVHRGGVVGGGGGGGQQTHIRFSNGDTHYLVYSGYTGRLAEKPGRWSGVAIVRAGRVVANLQCPYDGPHTEIAVTAIPDFVPQEPDDSYDAWY